MIPRSPLPKPLRTFAIVLTGSVFIGAVMLMQLYDDPRFDIVFVMFIAVMMVISLVAVIGILSMRRWGLVLFKGFLYLLMLGIPIGTYLAQKTLLYIRENKIERLYK